MKRFFFTLALFSSLAFCALPVAWAAGADDFLPNKNPIGSGSNGTELPSGNLKKEIVPQAIRMTLILTGVASVGVFSYAGVMLVIAQGNEEEITKFKNILIWSLVGLAFVTTAYTLVSGLLRISFT